MKFYQLTESSMDHFSEIDTFKFDPDRTDAFDIVHTLMPLLVKMGYCNMMEDKARHEKDMPLDEKSKEEEEWKDFEMTSSTLVNCIDDVINHLKNRLDDVTISDMERAVKLEKHKFKIPLQD